MNDQDCIVSQIRVMLEQERAQAYRCMDYLSHRTEFGPADREALCNWGFEAIACCTGIDRLTAVKAISYFDRFMSTSSSDGIGLEAIQLAFVASLVIALKVESGLNVELDFVANFVTKGAYDKEEIKRMEMEVLQALEWRLSGPTPHDFVDRFLEIVPGIDAMNLAFLNQFSKAVSEASIVRYCIACQNPSVIAFSAICCSCELARSINAVDSCASQYSLQTVSGLIFADSIQESVIKTMVRIMLAIISLELSSFAARAESESMPASSDDSFSSTS